MNILNSKTKKHTKTNIMSLPVQIYKYQLDANYHRLHPEPVYYLYLGRANECRSSYYAICTLTPTATGRFARVGLHAVQLDSDPLIYNKADYNMSKYVPDVIRIIETALNKYELSHDYDFSDGFMIQTAYAAVAKMRSTRLSEIRSSCAQRVIVRAWRKLQRAAACSAAH